MFGLLGKIADVTVESETPGGCRVTVRFTPVCGLPGRTPAPAWLKGQLLTLEREVADAREIGGLRDNIVLGTEEAARWLFPLRITPAISSGEVPETLTLTLHWWKDTPPPTYTAQALGRALVGSFTKTDDAYTATFSIADLLTVSSPALPLEVTVTCENMQAVSTILPSAPFAHKVSTPNNEVYRLENVWYSIDVLGSVQAGGIVAWRERGRVLDHFQPPTGIIQTPLDLGGHADRVQMGWGGSDKLAPVAMACGGMRREGGTTRLFLDGLVDEGMSLRTTLLCQTFDDLPLLLWQREFQWVTGKAPDKEKDDLLKEPIDAVKTFGVGFRSAWQVDRDSSDGSRFLSAYSHQLVVQRSTILNDWQRSEGWRMDGGWALVEHPFRRACMLYLFDMEHAPFLRSWSGTQIVTFEPAWLPGPLSCGESRGFTLAMCAGELSGATANGAWVACRTVRPDGGVQCGMIARLAPDGPALANITVGSVRCDLPLATVLLPGIGAVSYAVAEFPDGALEDTFDAFIAGIERR